MKTLRAAPPAVSSVEPEPASPCVQLCRLDDDICIGCGRTIDEIGEWSAASARRKHEIVARAAERRAVHRSGESK